MTDKITPLPMRACQFHGGRTGEDGLLVFCGNPTLEGYSYCPEHHPRIYQRARNATSSRTAESVNDPATEEAAEVVPASEIQVEEAA